MGRLKRVGRKFQLSTLIAFISIISIIASVAVTSVVNIYRSNEFNVENVTHRIDVATDELIRVIENNVEKAENNAMIIGQSEDVAKAVQTNNFKDLKRVLDAMNEYLKADTISITDKNGVILIRQHQPEKLGDSIIDQVNIQKALKGELVSNIEPGAIVKLSSRAASAIRDKNNNIIGAVVTGYTFENMPEIDILKKIHGVDLSIMGGEERISTTIIQNNQRMVGTIIDENVSKVLQMKERYSGEVDVLGEPHLGMYKPLLDSDGAVVGSVSSFISLKEIDNEKNTNINITLGIATALVLTSSLIIIAFVVFKIKRPLGHLTQIMDKVSAGNLNVDVDENKYTIKELYLLTKSVKTMSDSINLYITDIDTTLTEMASNNFTYLSDLEYIGDFSSIKNSLANIHTALNNTLSNVAESSNLVSAGIEQIANGAHSLASGSAEQASSIEELSASIENITNHIDINSSRLNEVGGYVDEANQSTIRSNQQMGELKTAIQTIVSMSNEISSITKSIEDIAFQTNILALNAAIEAARAGEAGKGFAVVADEVRVLAQRSAEAAKHTSELTEEILQSIVLGEKVTEETALSLSEMTKIYEEIMHNFQDINKATYEQVTAINEIKAGVQQISTVVQANAATAEENSAASEEINNNAIELRAEVSKFRLM